MSMKGNQDLVKAKIVRLDVHAWLLKENNDLLERKCEDKKATVNTLCMVEQKEDIYSQNSVFRFARKHRSVVTNMA